MNNNKKEKKKNLINIDRALIFITITLNTNAVEKKLTYVIIKYNKK